MKSNQSEILFLLGAGASVFAGVPDTYGIVDEFIEHISDHRDKRRTIERIIQILRNKRKELRLSDEHVDVELLLETLERLEKREQEPVLWFYKLGQYILQHYSEKRPLKDELKEFIKRKAIVEADRITYLEPLLAFVEEHRPLDVFSVNYDTCIEQFCYAYRRDCQDGFDINWNPETFKRDTDVRLYKLHGSVTWYRSDRGNYLKIPIVSESPSVTLFSKEKAETLILYPMRKWEYAEPMLELLVDLKRKLEVVRYVFVIGYSFRDDYIRRIFWDAARKNMNMVIFLIGPRAPEIYNEKLRYFDGPPASKEQIPSSLAGKVICLPYKFEEIFPRLKNHYFAYLRAGQQEERQQREAEVRGQPPNWAQGLKHFVECEYLSKVEQLLEKIDFTKLDWMPLLEISLKMLMSAVASGDMKLAREWAARFKDGTPWLSSDRLDSEVMISPRKINIRFAYSENTFLPAHHVLSTIDRLAESAQQKSKLCVERKRKRLVEPLAEGLRGLKIYLSIWGTEGMEYLNYLENRRQSQPELVSKFQSAYEELSSDPRLYNDKAHKLCKDAVKEIEREELSKALSKLNECVETTMKHS